MQNATLIAAREAVHMTAEQVAQISNIPLPVYLDYENGEYTPFSTGMPHRADAIADAIGVTVGQIFDAGRVEE